MEDKQSLFSCFLDYVEACEKQTQAENGEFRKSFILRTQRIYEFQERQKTDLVELRKCIEYINQHAHVIQSALRDSEGSEGSVPLCSSIVREIIQMKSSIQESINNAIEIKKIVGANYEPFMNNLLKKMETELNNWSMCLNVTSRALVNSKALVENIQNLIVAQQQICAEVASSELFSTLKDENITPQSPDMLASIAIKRSCSTPIADSN